MYVHPGVDPLRQRDCYRPVAIGQVADLVRPVGPGAIARPQVTWASTNRPLLSSVFNCVVEEPNSGRSRTSVNMWLARLSGPATRPSTSGSTSWAVNAV